jgi:hypothetical protein
MNQVMKTYGGVEGEILVFLTSALDVDESTVTPAAVLESLTPPAKMEILKLFSITRILHSL